MKQNNPRKEYSESIYLGPRWLVEERDACGVGFLATTTGKQNHQIIEQAVKALDCLEHRGGCSADRDTGDGSGIMTEIPYELFEPWFAEHQIEIPEEGTWGVGMVFLPHDPVEAEISRQHIEEVVARENLTVLGWRQVPVNLTVLGLQAEETRPQIKQIIVKSSEKLTGEKLERSLYIARSHIGKLLSDDFYFCSFSSRTIVYKGLVRGEVLGQFYQDLTNPSYKSKFAVYHRRFSTNTMPRWPFAQPMRLLGHNGEINTLLGNINWMMAREVNLAAQGWTTEELESLKPIVNVNNSDSYNLDSTMELLVRTGKTPLEAAMILVPEAYHNQPGLAKYPEISDFYDYYSGLQEPWDGPALLVFSDGKIVGATLDRNGLRPARYCLTKNDLVIVASEAGVIEIPPEDILEKGRLGPGEMLAVDLQEREILRNWEIKEKIALSLPYKEWLKARVEVGEIGEKVNQRHLGESAFLQQQVAFGYTAEDVEMVIVPMASQGKEPTFCMGDDIPLAVLSEKPHLVYNYFKQRFAQVTNPPIDPIREGLVMSLEVLLGKRGNILAVTAQDARLLELKSPLLNEGQLNYIKQSEFKTVELGTVYPLADGPSGLAKALTRLCQQAEQAVKEGAEIIILSDRVALPSGVIKEESSYIPPLLAVGAVHQHLIHQGVRLEASLIVDTAQCWSTHHYACLIGYGASAVCPYLTWETIYQWWNEEKTQKLMQNGKLPAITLEKALENYRRAVEAGLLKILSKMGISLLSSYHGAQIFEAIGLGTEVIDIAFGGTTSRVGGMTLKELASEVAAFLNQAFPTLKAKKLENYGFVNYRPGGEYHMNSPEMAKALHKAVKAEDYDHYQLYQKYIAERPITALRDLLTFQSDRPSIPLETVEPVEEIVKRFCTGGMSLGALSREAHETLAIAMNRIGGKSNSGEGGEDTLRYQTINDVDSAGKSTSFAHLHGLVNGDSACSAIKQVASGRFGVTPAYLMSGRQIEIKMAQGAKPGEGGQLPGPKVSPYIAMLRRSKPGVPLISPPPHHDIYSIEDLAQLIYDLHQINPQAQVSVKLVAEIGIGTIAAGVAKGNADIIQISGHDGGTGASPLSSIKHAGTPWELGLTEVHRVLLENQLRDRVLLRVDGGFKTGHDVVMGALMGAQEYGFGSVAMIAAGCIMARICHTNNCPVGVASQQERLRQRFSGTPAQVVNFFYFIAEEVRHVLAHLGYTSLTEIIGRADLLTTRKDVKPGKTHSLNLEVLTHLPDVKSDRSWLNHISVHSNGPVLDDEILTDNLINTAIANQGFVTKELNICNTNRSVGTRIAGKIAFVYGDTGFSGEITLKFTGSAGQSFGAFNLQGMRLILSGEANDYVGKGMNGGEIIIYPPQQTTFDSSKNSIIGNTCLYGATGGYLFANGTAGERFAVRNSLAKAVVEGAGDHCCEYMTGGVIVVLGPVGRNVGAGMTGGLAYFLDEEGDFPAKVNPEIVKIQRVVTSTGEKQLRELIQAHVEKTQSPWGAKILADWQSYLPKFWQVVPPSEANSPEVTEDATQSLTSV
ncbi:MAG: glutamate synthase large subunit [Gloeocapsa sp. DLM2.Bin57]|nr:MAG: glutamate synthase large subunit [Gloeocapsa sp. DLM2.Bin57]